MKKILLHQCCGGTLRIIKILSVQTFFALLLASITYAHVLRGNGIKITDNKPYSEQNENTTGYTENLILSVAGTVFDENSQSLPGVNVIEKGTTNGTTTDANGKFSLNVQDENSVLVFSFIGYSSQEVIVGNQSVINISMQPHATALEEIVVIGYGEQKKVNLTGAVETVNVDDFQSRPLTNASAALQGNVAGAFISQRSGQPGKDDATILIRGVGTFNNNNPLVLIDRMEGNLNDVNPKDIKSISVLKDAASAAIYGNRAANGVILITTRQGSDQMKIDYTGYYGVQNVTSMPELLTGVEYLELAAKAQFNTNGTYPAWYNDTYMNNFRNHVDEIMYPTNYSWIDEIFSPAKMTDHYVNISGGNKQFKYSSSIGYLDQEGIVYGNNTKKLTFRTNLSSNFLNDKLRIDLFTSGNDQRTNDLVDGMTTAMYFVYVAPPTARLYIPGVGYSTYGYNQAAIDVGGYRRERSTPINVRMAANYNLAKGLELNTSYNIYKSNAEMEIFRPTVQLYSLKDDGTVLKPEPQQSSLTYNNSESMTKVFNAYANYTTTFFKELEFSITGGFETREFRNDWISASREKLSANLPELSIGDPNSQKNSGGASDGAWQSWFSRINLNFKGKYLVESNIRRDGSSRFLKKYGIFPSFSAGWIVSKESFIEDNVSQISNLKLRTSWGRLGNEGIGQFYAASDELSLNLFNNFNNTLYPAGAVTKLANKNTSWETSEQLNYGLDLGLFNNKITLVIDYFTKNNSDILMQIPVSSTLGLSTTPYQNVGKMKNEGVEVQIGYSGEIKELKIGANIAVNHTTNKIVSLAGRDPIIFGNLIWKEGEAFNSFYGYQTEGIYQSQDEINNHLSLTDDSGQVINPYVGLTPYPGDIRLKDQNGDGIVNSKDRTLLGKPFPDWTFSSSLTFEWKNFDLSLFFQGVSGINSLNQFMITAPFHGGGAATGAWYRDGWTQERPSKTIQRVSSDPSRFEIVSDYYLEDASYIRLKNFVIGYTLPKTLLSKYNVSNIRIFANLQNAFTITKMRYGFDPEKPGTTTTTLQYPQTRIFSAGLSFRL